MFLVLLQYVMEHYTQGIAPHADIFYCKTSLYSLLKTLIMILCTGYKHTYKHIYYTYKQLNIELKTTQQRHVIWCDFIIRFLDCARCIDVIFSSMALCYCKLNDSDQVNKQECYLYLTDL